MILLLADTPVAGTVQRFAKWIEILVRQKVVCIIKRNYVGNPFPLDGTIPLGSCKNWKDIVKFYVLKARKIIIHNVADLETVSLVFEICKDSEKIAYHFHSPPLEGPLEAYDIIFRHAFSSIFTTAQGHSRFIENSIPVPNISPDCNFDFPLEKQNVIFIPHLRSTNNRWSCKLSDVDKEIILKKTRQLEGMQVHDIRSVFNRDVVSHAEILFYLHCCTIVIDDLNTGLFHQISLEGLKAGAVVFNGADHYSIDDFSATIEAPPPPFLLVNNASDLVSTISSKAFKNSIVNIQNEALSYATRFLKEERIARIAIHRMLDFFRL